MTKFALTGAAVFPVEDRDRSYNIMCAQVEIQFVGLMFGTVETFTVNEFSSATE